MDLQRQALRFMRDVIDIVLKWNDKKFSDKEAMGEIVNSLLQDKVPAKPVKKPEIKQKPRSSFRFQKKLVAPIAISAIFFIILFGIVNPYTVFTSVDTNTSSEDKKIGFEQLRNTDPQNIENIQNKTIEKFITQTTP